MYFKLWKLKCYDAELNHGYTRSFMRFAKIPTVYIKRVFLSIFPVNKGVFPQNPVVYLNRGEILDAVRNKSIILAFLLLPTITLAQGFKDSQSFGNGYSTGSVLSRILDKSASSKMATSTKKVVPKVTAKPKVTSNVTFSKEQIEESKKKVTKKDGTFDPYACLLDPICSRI